MASKLLSSKHMRSFKSLPPSYIQYNASTFNVVFTADQLIVILVYYDNLFSLASSDSMIRERKPFITLTSSNQAKIYRTWSQTCLDAQNDL